MDSLESARQRVAQIDHEIVELISARMEVVAALGKIKKERGIPLRDWEVEKRVLDRVAEQAKAHGISPELVLATMRLLIKESRVQQERLHYSAYSGEGEDILIIGGAGKMGRWFAGFFEDQGHRVLIHDVAREDSDFRVIDDLDTGLKQASLVLIATPLDGVPQTLAELARHRYTGTVFDIASLKGHLKEAIRHARDAGMAVTSIHPMFGAGAQTLSDKVICFCDCGDTDALIRVESLFRETAVKLVRLTLDEHDKIVSYVLGLSHLINILFASVLRDSGLAYKQLESIGSTTFSSQMHTTSTVIRENPDLYYAIQHFNPFTPKLLDSLKNSLETTSESIHGDSPATFSQIMKDARAWVEGDA